MLSTILKVAPFAIGGLYILSLMPGKKRPELFEPFNGRLFAHRGYYDNDSNAPENSIPAFKEAVARGYGVELDVQITKDGKLVVFHDENLRRMCGVDLVLCEQTFDELEKYRLMDSDEKIPLFSDVFEIVKNKVPLLVELKAHGDYIKTAEVLMSYLDSYDGPYFVQSFHPQVVHWFKKNRPGVLRGQLSMVFEKKKDGVPRLAKWVATNLLTNIYARPDFISYCFQQKDQFSYRLMRWFYKPENAAWTIRSKQELERAKKEFDIYIFDSFDPSEPDDD